MKSINNFAKILSELREQKGITQQQLANAIGITQQTLSRYEKAERTINIELLTKIAVFFNVPTDYLLGLSDISITNNNSLKPCPFCGCKLNEYPKIMVIRREYEDAFVEYKHNKGDFIGTNDYRVYCPRCGARGKSNPNKEKAFELWNKRYEENDD